MKIPLSSNLIPIVASMNKQQIAKFVIEPARLLRRCQLRTLKGVLEQTANCQVCITQQYCQGLRFYLKHMFHVGFRFSFTLRFSFSFSFTSSFTIFKN